MESIQVRVPATTANCGPGFDTLGIALQCYNYFTFTPDKDAKALTYHYTGLGSEILAQEDPADSLIGKAMQCVLTAHDTPMVYGHVDVRLHIPPSRGLGSSSSAIVAGLLLGQSLLKHPIKRDVLLDMANMLEGHPDNVAPALLGNLICATQEKGHVWYSEIPVPEALRFAVLVPDTLVSTAYAREVLPEKVDRKQAVATVGYATLLVSSLLQGNLDNLKVALQDYLHQPYRCPLIPESENVFAAAKQAGAYGATISGSGSTLIAYCNENTVEKVKEAMAHIYEAKGLAYTAFTTQADTVGATYL